MPPDWWRPHVSLILFIKLFGWIYLGSAAVLIMLSPIAGWFAVVSILAIVGYAFALLLRK